MAARRYLEEFGVRIADNGYEVIPIIPGEKRPAGEKWQKFDGSAEGVGDHIADGKGAYGVGIKSRYAPAVDIDVLDNEVNREIQAIVEEVAGKSPLRRVGLYPKVLWVYRAEPGETWPKVDTGEWFDPVGRKAKVEILADGQQFVAAHIHPDTGKPYQWLDGSVLNVARAELPTLTHEQAEEIKQRSLQVFIGHGWIKKSKNAITRLQNPMDDDDPFSAYRPKVQIGDGELERRLMAIKDNEDHDTWFQIGMALYHQFDGSQQGFDLWDQWSQGASNYDSKELEKRWPTFDNKDRSHTPITCRIVLKLSKDAAVAEARETLKDILKAIEESADTDALVEVCNTIKHIEFATHVREVLLGKIKGKWKDLTKEMPRIGFIRDLIRYENKEIISAPPWAKNWTYLSQTDSFYNYRDRSEVNRIAFNSLNARHLISPGERLEGKATPEQSPADMALNLYQIPTVYNRMYMPGYPDLYEYKGLPYINSYSDADIPELPAEISPVQQAAIDTFLGHFIHLVEDAQDRAILLDWIAYVVQNPGKRINWAILLQGAEGDGKSFFRDMLEQVLGGNVNGINGTALEEKYNAWAEGAMLCFVEDVRLHGNNRFDAVNKLKPMITNTMVSIRRMQTDSYEVVNTMNYMATSNLKDAVPVTDEDTRFFPIFTRYQTPEALDRFKLSNPNYYRQLYGLTSDSEFAGAIRHYLLNHKFSMWFDPKARAPRSSYKQEMILLNRSEEQNALRDSLEESVLDDYSELLLDSGKLADQFMGSDALPPKGKALNRLLSQHGFTLLGRFKIGGEKRQYWSMKPEAWPRTEMDRADAIRDFLDPNGL
jgi:hypothetical protein